MLKSEALTHGAGGDIACYIDVPCGPVEASLLQLAYGLVSTVVAGKAAVTGADVVHVFGFNCEVALSC